jgi:hypothetical protein
LRRTKSLTFVRACAEAASNRARSCALKVAAALDLIVRFFGSAAPVCQIDRKRCRDFWDLPNQLPSNMRKRFPDQAHSLNDIASDAANRRLDLLARETQDVYFNVLKRLS